MSTVSPQTVAFTQNEYQTALPSGYKLRDYVIKTKLGQGGFGITYLAAETFTGRNVVIKENFPEYCSRRNINTLLVLPNDERNAEDYLWALEHFQQEAEILAKLDHPNIVTVLNAFPALGTAYYVMKPIQGTEQPTTESPEQLLQKAHQYYNDKNDTQAVRLLQPLAEQGLPEAQDMLGYCYENGIGVEQDSQQAVYWYRKAADNGNKYAKDALNRLEATR